MDSLTLARINLAGTTAVSIGAENAGYVPLLNSIGKLDTSLLPASDLTALQPDGDGSGLSGVLHSFTEADPLFAAWQAAGYQDVPHASDADTATWAATANYTDTANYSNGSGSLLSPGAIHFAEASGVWYTNGGINAITLAGDGAGITGVVHTEVLLDHAATTGDITLTSTDTLQKATLTGSTLARTLLLPSGGTAGKFVKLLIASDATGSYARTLNLATGFTTPSESSMVLPKDLAAGKTYILLLMCFDSTHWGILSIVGGF